MLPSRSRASAPHRALEAQILGSTFLCRCPSCLFLTVASGALSLCPLHPCPSPPRTGSALSHKPLPHPGPARWRGAALVPLAEPRFCTHLVFPEDVFLFVLGGYSAEHPVIKVFWRVVEGFTDEEKRKLLKFVTSCSRPPLLGFKVHGLGAQRCSGRGSRAKWASVRAACSEDSVCCSGRSAQAVTFYCVCNLINPVF